MKATKFKQTKRVTTTSKIRHSLVSCLPMCHANALGLQFNFHADGECMKTIPVSEFCNHVEQLHADRDKLFEMEYTVSYEYTFECITL